MSDCKCKSPCNPCNKNCPDDKITVIRDTIDASEPLEVELLDADECSGPCWGCCSSKCNDNCGINIQSTNECLTVDTSECGVVKLTSHCPPIVTAWENVTVDVEDCNQEWCSLNYIVSAQCKDEKVKACLWDSTPWTLIDKLEEGTWINIDAIGCDWNDAKVRISVDTTILPDCPDIPDITIDDFSDIIEASANGHHITITDNLTKSFDNVVCIWFEDTKKIPIQFDNDWNATEIKRVEDYWQWWTIFTWNKKMATPTWIKILKSWHYRIFGQLTVQNNGWVNNDQYFINLWRAFLKIVRWWQDIYLSTAKHWAYGRQVLLTGGAWINVGQDWDISFTWWSWYAPEWWWTVHITPAAWWWTQTNLWFDGPWATFNIEACVDLQENDKISLWYRAQSDMKASEWSVWSIRFVWANDTTTEFERIFWWTLLWVEQITPTLFQAWEANKLYWYINS